MNNAGINPADPRSAPGASPASAAPAEGAPRPSILRRFLAYRTLIVIALVVLGLDQLTKSWIAAHLPFGTYGEHAGAIPVIRGFCYFVHVGNTGAAWSLLSGQSIFLALLAASTLVAIVIWRRALGLHDRLTQVCFGLLCGGISGNLLDRLLHGHVIDFIDLHFGSYIYPTFNVADSGICVGVILYLWHGFREK